MEFVNIFLLAEYGAESAVLIHYVDLFGIPSLLFSVFAAQVMIRLSTDYLREHKMMALFYCVIMTLPFYCMQPALIFDLLLIKLNFFPCGPLLGVKGNARCKSKLKRHVIYFSRFQLCDDMRTPYYVHHCYRPGCSGKVSF